MADTSVHALFIGGPWHGLRSVCCDREAWVPIASQEEVGAYWRARGLIFDDAIEVRCDEGRALFVWQKSRELLVVHIEMVKEFCNGTPNG